MALAPPLPATGAPVPAAGTALAPGIPPVAAITGVEFTATGALPALATGPGTPIGGAVAGAPAALGALEPATLATVAGTASP